MGQCVVLVESTQHWGSGQGCSELLYCGQDELQIVLYHEKHDSKANETLLTIVVIRLSCWVGVVVVAESTTIWLSGLCIEDASPLSPRGWVWVGGLLTTRVYSAGTGEGRIVVLEMGSGVVETGTSTSMPGAGGTFCVSRDVHPFTDALVGVLLPSFIVMDKGE